MEPFLFTRGSDPVPVNLNPDAQLCLPVAVAVIVLSAVAAGPDVDVPQAPPPLVHAPEFIFLSDKFVLGGGGLRFVLRNP